MKLLTIQDLLPAEEYERQRSEYRRRIIEFKEHRRIAVGDLVTLVFENRDTVLFQIQEMIRAERIVAPERIREELEMYNEQIPRPGELSATLLINVTDAAKIKEILDRFQGIDKNETVAMQLGEDRSYGLFEQGRTKEDKISAVHYVRFPVSDQMKKQWSQLDIPMKILVHHSGYQATSAVPDKMRLSLLQDLG